MAEQQDFFNPDELPTNTQDTNALYAMVPQENDDRGVKAEFSVQPVHMGFRSREEGRQIFEDRVFVRILVKGNDKMEVVREATEQDFRRFPREYAAFKAGSPQLRVGTPLSAIAGLGPSMILHLESLNIHTVEDLAECGDNVLPNLGTGARILRDKAQAMLGNSNPEVDKLKAQLEETNALLARAMEKLDRLDPQKEPEIPKVRPRRKRRAPKE